MKKISLLLVVLLAAGSAGLYGQMAIGTEFKISGDATATVGYDIDDEQFGFKNDFSSNISLALVAESSVNNADMVGMEGWVGTIELNEFKIIIDNDEEDSDLRYKAADCRIDEDGDQIKEDQPNAADCAKDKTSRSKLVVVQPTIVAKLKNGPLFLKIFDKPGSAADLVAAVEDDDNTEGDSDATKLNGGRDAESDDGDLDVGLDLDGAGVTLGYDGGEALMVAVGIASTQAWDADNPDAGSFVVSGELAVNLGPAGLKLQVVQGLMGDADTKMKNDDTGVAAELKTTFGVVELTAGADVRITNDEDMDTNPEDESMYFEVGLGAAVTLAEVMDAEGMVTASTKFGADYIYSSEQMVASDVKVTLEDTGGLVDRLGMGLTWGLFDISNGVMDFAASGDQKYVADMYTHNDQMDMFVEGKLSYKLDAMGGTLTPEATLTLNQIDDMDATVGLTVKAVLADAVPATEFGLQWATSQLTDTDDPMMMADSGTITAWAKISYS